MYVSWILWLSTLYSNVISSYVKRHGDATWFPLCPISASSHHLHSHRAQFFFFPRCGVLVASFAAEGWKTPWHFAVRPVAETLDNHLWLQSLLLPVKSLQQQYKTKIVFSAPEHRPPLLPVKHVLRLHTETQQSANVPTFKAPPGEGAAAALDCG